MKKVLLNRKYRVDFEAHTITDITLTKKEPSKLEPRLMHLLQLLVERPCQVVPRQELIEKIWGNYNSGESLLTHSISMLRRHFKESVIETIPKGGYLLTANVDKVQARMLSRIHLTPAHALYIIPILLLIKNLIFGHH